MQRGSVGGLGVLGNSDLEVPRECDVGEGDRLAAHYPLRAELTRWVNAARHAGLDDESINALIATTLRGIGQGDPVTAQSEAVSSSTSARAAPAATSAR